MGGRVGEKGEINANETHTHTENETVSFSSFSLVIMQNKLAREERVTLPKIFVNM